HALRIRTAVTTRREQCRLVAQRSLEELMAHGEAPAISEHRAESEVAEGAGAGVDLVAVVHRVVVWAIGELALRRRVARRVVRISHGATGQRLASASRLASRERVQVRE